MKKSYTASFKAQVVLKLLIVHSARYIPVFTAARSPTTTEAPIIVGLDPGNSEATADGFLAQHGRELSLAERRSLLWAHAQRAAQPPILVDGRPVVIGDAVARAIGRVGGDIRCHISRRWRSSEQGAVVAEAARALQTELSWEPNIRSRVVAITLSHFYHDTVSAD